MGRERAAVGADAGVADQDDPGKGARDGLDRVLSDGFMVFLALLMVPIVLLPMLIPDLDAQYLDFLDVADLVIIAMFYIEYFLKLAVAHDRRRHFLDAWHLLDLFIIILPVLEVLPFVSSTISRRAPLLRLVRLARLAAVGGRTMERKRGRAAVQAEEPAPAPRMRINVVNGEIGKVLRDVSKDQMMSFWRDCSQTWIDICGIPDSELDGLSATTGIPRIVLESKLVEESYPRIDYMERQSVIFLQAGSTELRDAGTHRLVISRTGLLIVCCGSNIMTVSRGGTEIFEDVHERAIAQFPGGQPLLVAILYSLLGHIIHRYKQVVAEVEKELLRLENIPRGETPRDFLETSFQLKKEVNRLVSSLLHLKEVLTVIMSRRVPLEGFEKSHEELFDILADETVYLHETAQNSKDDLSSLIELHINTTSYQMNRVMRVIAVITCLAIIPTLIGGMLGMNIIGASWPVRLWQVVTMTLAAMAGVAYIFYKLGWLKD
jgi:magnesium transporter